jgi:hypothetical protein
MQDSFISNTLLLFRSAAVNSSYWQYLTAVWECSSRQYHTPRLPEISIAETQQNCCFQNTLLFAPTQQVCQSTAVVIFYHSRTTSAPSQQAKSVLTRFGFGSGQNDKTSSMDRHTMIEVSIWVNVRCDIGLSCMCVSRAALAHHVAPVFLLADNGVQRVNRIMLPKHILFWRK